MSRTRRTGSSKTAQRVVPLLVGVAVAAMSAVLLSGDPASASQQVTVKFTADGPTPSAVSIRPGDQVTYENDVDPNSGNLLGVVTGLVKSVTVNVQNATQTPLKLTPGQHQTFTYSQPVKTTYTATYQPTMLLGLSAGKTMTATGTVSVANPSNGSVPVVTPAPAAGGGSMSPQMQSGGQSTGSAQQDDAQQNDPAAQRTAQPAGPEVNYTPNAGDVAAGQVPRGGSAAQAPAGPDAAPSSASGTHLDPVTELPQLGSAQSRSRQLDRASSDRAIGSLGLPAITAVVLLSMVSAGLVRTIMVRSASLA